MDLKDLIFALDIGTRTVVGIVGRQEGECFHVLAYETMEHKSRVMLDGQIHDIDQVASIVHQVKSRLESKLNLSLNKAVIAAAGRVLRTKLVKIELNIDIKKEIDLKLIKSLEMKGIQHAQAELNEELPQNERTFYYCVGYDIVSYYLNGYIISSLAGHKGSSIGADVLATFLPHTVVDSLYTVMNRINLEVASLTLEPIAAINVAIPKDLRLLNLALVDIGAGTSDIAITRNGSVAAYAMVPIAGDEITETICQQYLLDFNTAENVKLTLSSPKEEITFTDIMGIKQTKTVAEIKSILNAPIKQLAEIIAKKILEYNQKAPNAVFLVGGGSRMAELPELIAKNLNLPLERIAVRERTFIKNIKISGRKLNGPEAITPIGIAVTAQIQNGQDFIPVTVNKKMVRLLNTRRQSVADALVLSGYSPTDLIGKTGPALHFVLNGESKTLNGEYGEAAVILINGREASLETPVFPGDEISVTPGKQGAPARLTVQDIVEYYAGKNYTIYVNGKHAPIDYQIRSGDILEAIYETPPNNVAHKDSHLNKNTNAEKDNTEIGVNTYTTDVNISSTIVKHKPLPLKTIKVTVNGKEVTVDGNKQEYIFTDIFNYIDFDLSKPQGTIVLNLNGKPAAFSDVITTGDAIDIYWKKG